MSRAPGRDADDLAPDLVRTLLLTSRVLRQRTADDGVSAPQFSVLAYLRREGPTAPGALAEFEKVTPPVMTRMISRLEGAGLVSRAGHPRDGRQVLVELTPDGVALVQRARRVRNDWLRERLARADAADLRTLAEASTILRRLLVEDEERPPSP